jgi:hypothetical protein
MILVNESLAFPRDSEEMTIREYCREADTVKQVLAKYKPFCSSITYGTARKIHILKKLLGDLEGKTILDIGCGAKNSWDYSTCTNVGREERYYDPWLCRTLHGLGAKVTGIDGGSSDGEEYRHIKAHLYDFEEIASQFANNSLNLACTFSFFDSPNLGLGEEMFHILVRGLRDKLKPEGFFIFEPTGTRFTNQDQWESYILQGERK